MMISKRVASALVTVLVAAIGTPAFSQMCTPAQECGDVNESGSVTSGDALGVLQRAVGLAVALQCSCNGGEECQAGGVIKTGQTKCWEPIPNSLFPTPPETPCDGTGQDGEYQRGLVPSFVDNRDGTITDKLTTLMWEKLSDDGSLHDYQDKAFHWLGAYEKIGALNDMAFAGYDDWRLPNARELSTLIEFMATAPPVTFSIFNTACTPGCSAEITCPGCPNADCTGCAKQGCSCTHSSSYWSSTTYEVGSTGPRSAFAVDFKTGTMEIKAKSSSSTPTLQVRAVRGGY